jgi:hypothetical protein
LLHTEGAKCDSMRGHIVSISVMLAKIANTIHGLGEDIIKSLLRQLAKQIATDEWRRTLRDARQRRIS